MQLFYNKYKKKTGMSICIIQGNTETYTGLIQDKGDLIMSWNPEFKKEIGKSCIMDIQNFREENYDEVRIEKIRLWFCKGNFQKADLKNRPIVLTNNLGKNRKDIKSITLKNAEFEIEFNNAISSERKSGATTILRVFSYDGDSK